MQRSNRASQICSILARVSCTLRCFGPAASAVMNGRLMSTDWANGEGDLRLLRLLLQALQGHRVLPQVDAVLLLEFVETRP